jgi:hypothetical protein
VYKVRLYTSKADKKTVILLYLILLRSSAMWDITQPNRLYKPFPSWKMRIILLIVCRKRICELHSTMQAPNWRNCKNSLPM